MTVTARRVRTNHRVFRRRRPDHEAVADVLGQPRLVLGDERLGKLLARPDAHELAQVPWRHRLRDIGNAVGRQLGYEDLAPSHQGQAGQHELDRLVESHVEARHARVSDWERTTFSETLPEQRNDGAAGLHDIAVPSDRDGRLSDADLVEGDEVLLGHQLRCAVVVDGVTGLVGGEGENARHACVHGGVADVHGAIDVGLSTLIGVGFALWNYLQGRCVDDEVDAAHGDPEAVAVADVADEEPQRRMAEIPLHLLLKMFAAAVDDQSARIITQNAACEGLPKRASSARDED